MKTEKQISMAAAEFAERWKGRGYERGESQPFWIDLLMTRLPYMLYLIEVLLQPKELKSGLTGDRHGVIPTLLVRDVDSQYVDLW